MPTSSLLFRRLVRLVIASPSPLSDANVFRANALEVTDLRVQFKIEKSLEKEPNSATIQVFNLSPTTRAALVEKGSKVALEAGYADTLATIFVGDVRMLYHVREGTEWVTKIECGDGQRAFLHARIKESFAGGVPGSDVVNKLAGSLGLNVSGQLQGMLSSMQGQFLQGFTAHGPTLRELDKVLTAMGFEWSIQDDTLQVLEPGGTNQIQVPELTPETGLVGALEHASSEKKGGETVIKGKCLLRPEIIPGSRLVVRSSSQDGAIRVTRVSHTGDTAGGEWYSSFEGEPIE